jgi:predicted nuclease of predicted toxin-antitoxin system
MKLLVDMSLSPRRVALLRDAGWEVEPWSAIGRHNARNTSVSF